MSRQAARQAVHLLGGAQRVRTRARGFAPWSPEKATLAWLDQVQAVLDEYVDYLPLTIRQARTITRRPSTPISGSANTSIALAPPHGPAPSSSSATVRAMAKEFSDRAIFLERPRRTKET